MTTGSIKKKKNLKNTCDEPYHRNNYFEWKHLKQRHALVHWNLKSSTSLGISTKFFISSHWFLRDSTDETCWNATRKKIKKKLSAH